MREQLKAFLVGVGPGSPDFVTPEAHRAIAASEIVLGWDLDLRPVADLLCKKKVYLQDVSNYVRATRAAVRQAKRSRSVLAVPRVGDPCLSSGLKGLLRALEGFEVQIVPGVSSVQLMAALARINLDETVVVSFHSYGDPEDKKRFMLECFRRGRHLMLLASPDLMPGPAASWLIENGVPRGTPTVVGSFLTLPEERIIHTRLSRLVGREFPWLSITALINPKVPSLEQEHRTWRRWQKRHSANERRGR
jgi:cobalt-precorrin-7 (C5)-methyltransferase